MKLFHDIVYIMSLGFALGCMFDLLHLPTFFVYITTGVVLGPSYMNRIKGLVQIETVSQFGILFILFTLGLEFSMDKIRRHWRITTIGGILSMLATIIASILLGLVMNLEVHQGFFLGWTLSLSSTTVVIKCLSAEDADSIAGQAIVGILVIQDMALGLLLAALPTLAEGGNGSIVGRMGWVIFKTAAFVVISWLVGRLIITPLLRTLKLHRNRELQILGYVAVSFAFLLVAEKLSVSVEVAVFMAGVVLNNRHNPTDNKSFGRMEALRDFFACLFFSTIGLHVYPTFLFEQAPLLILSTMCVMGFKITASLTISTFLLRIDVTSATAIAIGLSQVSEFAFVLASRAKSHGIISKEAYYILIGTTSISLLLTPFFWKAIHALSNRERNDKKERKHTPDEEIGLVMQERRKRGSGSDDVAISSYKRTVLHGVDLDKSFS